MASKPLVTEFKSPREFFEKITGRAELQLLSDQEIQDFYHAKKILITGAAGTIGSAVARRLKEAGIQHTFYLDRDESALHALALSLSDTAASHSANCLVADVRDLVGLRLILDEIKPDLIIHTAALKHLVVLERFPREGVLTNIIGTYNILRAAANADVKQVLNVSTDKAALPSSVLGKTKLIAEQLTHEFSNHQLLTSSVRFGNVFASRGSVIETFIHQIRSGLQVTVTHPEVTRFFMSHGEAANLILATCMMQADAVFVQEMGTRISIVDIVKRLSQALESEAKIKFIGLQPGEKMHEDLYEKQFLSTQNPAIVRLPDLRSHGIAELVSKVSQLESNQEALDLIELLLKQDEIVVEC
jgi:FlaA1/EpsC-like NDP-sugar epimerase